MTIPELRLKPRKSLPFFSHHPWVYPTALADSNDVPDSEAQVLLRSAEGRFIAYGLFNPHSNVRVRLYSWNEAIPLDDALWRQRIATAVELRRQLWGGFSPETACRLIFSEADQLSGLVVDRYGDWLVVQFTSRALAARKAVILDTLRELLSPRGIYLRTEKGIGSIENLKIEDGLAWGEAPPRPLFITEHGIRFGVDLAEGQKTGFFLDQRENRRRLADLASGKRVLDMFCYSGGFSMNALVHGGAREVVAIDGSEGAVRLATANAELNGVAERFRVTKEDGFKGLERLAAAGERFDVVVLDPPKMARRRNAVPAALRGYFSLNRLALDLLVPGGMLMTCSCSGVVSHDEFVSTLAKVSLDAGRHLQILEARGPSPDHPASIHCLESDYLKCYLCRVE